jgi:hypothetical protein
VANPQSHPLAASAFSPPDASFDDSKVARQIAANSDKVLQPTSPRPRQGTVSGCRQEQAVVLKSGCRREVIIVKSGHSVSSLKARANRTVLGQRGGARV